MSAAAGMKAFKTLFGSATVDKQALSGAVDAAGGAATRRRLSNVATAIRRGDFGSFNNAGTNLQRSFATIQTAERPFVAVQVILAHATVGQAMTVDRAKFYIPAAPVTNPAARTGTHFDFTFGGNPGVTLPALPALVTGHNRIEVAVSDWLWVDSVASAEGAKLLPMMGAKAYVSTNAGLTLVGAAQYNMTAFSNPTHGRIWRAMNDIGDKVTDPTTWTGNGAGTSAGGFSASTPILGFRYMARDGAISTVMNCEDSIGWGAVLDGGGVNIGWGNTGSDTGFYAKICWEISDRGGIGVEYANMGWPSTYMQSQGYRIRSLIAAGILPDLMFVMGGSPNNTGATITSAQIADMRRDLMRSLYDLRQAGVATAIRTMIPSSPISGNKPWGATDVLRRTHNDQIRAMASLGHEIFDAATPLAESVDGNGQEQLIFPDSVLHPTEASYALARPRAEAIIEKYATPVSGLVY